MSDGNHAFKVDGKNLSVNDAPILYQFSIDITPPVISILSRTPSYIDNTVSGSDGNKCYTFNVSTGAESGVKLYRKIDSGTWIENASGMSFSVCVSTGQHSVSVKGVNELGNESSPTIRTWTLLGNFYEQTIGGATVIRQRLDAGSTAFPYCLLRSFLKTLDVNVL